MFHLVFKMEIIKEKESRAGLIGTIVFHVILLLCIIFFGMSYQDPAPINESAMLIDFGYAGGGSSAASEESETESASETESSTNNLNATENVTASAPESMETQTTTETVEVNAANTTSSTTETTEPEQVISENLSNVMNALNNASNSSESSSTNSDGNADNGTSNGTGTGVGNHNGAGEGPGYDLAGRGKVSFAIPKNPTQEDGTVVVDIVVDRNGNVIKATPGGRGSTTTNSTLYKMAKDAALQARFTIKNGANDQKGSMAFVFILN